MSTVGSRHRSLRDDTVDELRRLILDGELAPGSKLTEASISERLGVSRLPVREAFRRLEAEGLLRSEPRRGVTVTESDPDELAAVREIRVALELMAVRRVATRCDPATTAAFRELLAAGAAAAGAADLETLEAVNERFHVLVGEGSGSRFLAETLRAAQNQARHLVGGKSGSIERSWREHALVIEALLDEDADYAELAMRRHLLARYRNQGGAGARE
jgi:GntR family transcriptional regulator, rspAB operon transcriptional repressor